MNMRPTKDSPLGDLIECALHLHPYLSDTQIAATLGASKSYVHHVRTALDVPSVSTITRELLALSWRDVHDRLPSMTDEEVAAELGCSPYTVMTYRMLHGVASGRPVVEVDAHEWYAAMTQLDAVHEQIVSLQESHRADRKRVEEARDRARKRADMLETMLNKVRETPTPTPSAGGETHFAPCRLDVSDVIETAGDATCGDRRRVEPYTVRDGVLTVFNELGLGVSVDVDDALRAALSNFQKVEP